MVDAFPNPKEEIVPFLGGRREWLVRPSLFFFVIDSIDQATTTCEAGPRGRPTADGRFSLPTVSDYNRQFETTRIYSWWHWPCLPFSTCTSGTALPAALLVPYRIQLPNRQKRQGLKAIGTSNPQSSLSIAFAFPKPILFRVQKRGSPPYLDSSIRYLCLGIHMALVSLRTLRRIAIVLLCLWILGLLAAVSDLLETSVIDAYSYGFSSDSGPSPFHRQRIKEQVRNRQKTYLRMHKSFLSQQRNHSNNNVSSLLLGDGNHHHRANLPSMNRSHSGHHHHESHPRRSSNNNRLRDAFVPDLSAPPLKLPKPIIVVGFPKAGTSSIFSFFRDQPEQNLKCQHWVRTICYYYSFMGIPRKVVSSSSGRIQHQSMMS
jgi:hypothetical protein